MKTPRRSRKLQRLKELDWRNSRKRDLELRQNNSKRQLRKPLESRRKDRRLKLSVSWRRLLLPRS